jgi:hypothetical protein
MTSYECLEAVVECLAGRGYRVLIGEADSGGYNRFAMDNVFETMGIRALAERGGPQPSEQKRTPSGTLNIGRAFYRAICHHVGPAGGVRSGQWGLSHIIVGDILYDAGGERLRVEVLGGRTRPCRSHRPKLIGL